jgi:hypothetical protein
MIYFAWSGFPQYAARCVGAFVQQPERYLHLENYNFIGRLKLLFQPKGCSLHDAFLYKRRNWGVARGVISIMHIVFKVVAR